MKLRFLATLLTTFITRKIKGVEYHTLNQQAEISPPVNTISTISEFTGRLNIRNTQTGVQFINIISGTVTKDLDIGEEIKKIVNVDSSDVKNFSLPLISYLVTNSDITMLTFTPDTDFKDYNVEKLKLVNIPKAAFVAPIKGSNRVVVGSLLEGENKLYRLDYSNDEEKVEIYANYQGKLTSLHHITRTTMFIFTSDTDNLVFLTDAASIKVVRRIRDLSFSNIVDSVYPEFNPYNNLILARDSKYVLGMNYESSETYFVLEFEEDVSIMKPVNNTVYACFITGNSTIMKFVDLEAAFVEDVSGKNLVSYSPSFTTSTGDEIVYVGVSPFSGTIQWVLNTSKTVDLIAESMIYCKKGCSNCTTKFSPISCQECSDNFTLEEGHCSKTDTEGEKFQSGYVKDWNAVVWVMNEEKGGLIDSILKNKSRVLTIFIIVACVTTIAITTYLHFKNKKKDNEFKPSMEELDVLAGKRDPTSMNKLEVLEDDIIDMKKKKSKVEINFEDEEGKKEVPEDKAENKKNGSKGSIRQFKRSQLGSKRSVRRGSIAMSRNGRKMVRGKSKMSKFVDE